MRRKRGSIVAAAAAVATVALGHAEALSAPASKPAPPRPAPPIPFLPSVGEVAIELTRDTALVTRDIVLPRGDYAGGALSFHVAYGAPGAPLAVEASLLPVEDGELVPRPSATRVPLGVERSPVSPPSAYALVGKADGAGVLIHVPESAFREATRPGGMAVLRYREAVSFPQPAEHGTADLVVRLGMRKGAPLALGRIVVEDKGFDLARAEARLCGDGADPHPLAVAATGHGRPLPKAPDAIAPVLSVRRPTDDLCLVFARP